MLREATAGDGVYLGPELSNYFSGVCLTVSSEVSLHAEGDPSGWAERFAIASLLQRNPFTLSGGEQVLALLTAACASGADALAVDTVLEQLDPDRRTTVMKILATLPRLLIADNRLAEFGRDLPRQLASHDPDGGLPIGGINAGVAPLSSDDVAAAWIEIDGVTFAYPKSGPVLRRLNAHLDPGVAYVLQGPNGAGKSTLAKLLTGVLRLPSGAIRYGGSALQPYKYPARVVSYHFQHPDVQLFCSTVRQEVASGAPAAPGRQYKIDAWLSAFGLTGVAEESPFDLPFVARKRVALAATLAMERPWCILDEPTLGQDDHAMAEIAAMLQARARAGLGSIIITHSQSFARLIGASVLRLEQGALSEATYG